MILKRKDMLIPVGHPNRPGIKSDSIDAFIFHYTANDNLGATDEANAKYFGRAYKKVGNTVYEADGKKKFGYGSTNKIIDKDSVATVIPIGEVTYNAGDRQYPYNNGYKGQTKLAAQVFGHRQNYRSVSYEMCNNDDWPSVVANTIEEAVRDLIMLGKEPGDVMFLRHYDLSGKVCPRAFVQDIVAWERFKADIENRYNEVMRMAGESIKSNEINYAEVIEVAKKAMEDALSAYFENLEKTSSNIDAKEVLKQLVEAGELEQPEAVLSEMTTTSALNLRNAPSTSGSKVILVIPINTKVQVVKDLDGWKEVYFKDLKGYVSAQYLK